MTGANIVSFQPDMHMWKWPLPQSALFEADIKLHLLFSCSHNPTMILLPFLERCYIYFYSIFDYEFNTSEPWKNKSTSTSYNWKISCKHDLGLKLPTIILSSCRSRQEIQFSWSLYPSRKNLLNVQLQILMIILRLEPTIRISDNHSLFMDISDWWCHLHNQFLYWTDGENASIYTDGL